MPAAGSSWHIKHKAGSCSTNPTRVPPSSVDISWQADASWYGGTIGGVDFALDIADPECETCTAPDGIGGWIGYPLKGKEQARAFETFYSASDIYVTS